MVVLSLQHGDWNEYVYMPLIDLRKLAYRIIWSPCTGYLSNCNNGVNEVRRTPTVPSTMTLPRKKIKKRMNIDNRWNYKKWCSERISQGNNRIIQKVFSCIAIARSVWLSFSCLLSDPGTCMYSLQYWSYLLWKVNNASQTYMWDKKSMRNVCRLITNFGRHISSFSYFVELVRRRFNKPFSVSTKTQHFVWESFFCLPRRNMANTKVFSFSEVMG